MKRRQFAGKVRRNDWIRFMPGFSIRNPYFISVICLVLLVIGVTSLTRMPVDLFPPINLPEVVVATFYSGMPPEDIETDITDPLERFFTLASGVDHMESRSLLGVSIIKVYFQPGTSPDADVTELSNLALADLKRLPPGTLPPVVLKFDASSLPVALVTVRARVSTKRSCTTTRNFRFEIRLRLCRGLRFRVCSVVPTGRSWFTSIHINCRRGSSA
jgi:multidrug efflux pump subunit AcrB